MLNDIEKKFIWNLINLKKGPSIEAINKINDKSNIVTYSIVNRIDTHLLYFITENNIEYKFSKKLLKHLNDAVSFKSFRSLIYYKEIAKISSLFIKNKIDHVFLKGSANICRDTEYLTPMRDIDILVAKKDIYSAVKLVTNLGFRRPDNSIYAFNKLPDDPYTYNLPLLINDKGVFLEIHYKIISEDDSVPCKFSKLMLQDKHKKNILGKFLYIPSDEDMILHYLYHGISKGNFDVGPLAVLNVSKLREVMNINYEILLQRSKIFGLNFEYKIFVALENFEKENVLIKKYLSEIFLMPTVNKRISSLKLQKGFLKKIKFIAKVVFVEKKLIMREFNLLNFSNFHYFLYLFRWLRQIKLLIKVSINNSKNKKAISNRTFIIERLKSKLS